MNSQSYIDIAKRIREKVPAVKTIDIFNHQYEEPEKHAAFACPAVLIEWLPTDWTDMPMGVQEGMGGFRIHCVVNTLRHARNIDQLPPAQAALQVQHLQFATQVHAALQGFAPDGYSPLLRVQSQPDHRFTGNVIIVQEYRAKIIDSSAYVYANYTEAVIEDFRVPGDIERQT
jgi:hypothetical protein